MDVFYHSVMVCYNRRVGIGFILGFFLLSFICLVASYDHGTNTGVLFVNSRRKKIGVINFMSMSMACVCLWPRSVCRGSQTDGPINMCFFIK